MYTLSEAFLKSRACRPYLARDSVIEKICSAQQRFYETQRDPGAGIQDLSTVVTVTCEINILLVEFLTICL